MKRIKLATVVGTRPEIIRLSRILARLDSSEAIENIVIHTGQNYDYELNELFFNDLGLRRPDVYLNAAGKSAAVTIGNVIVKTDEQFDLIRPDALLVLGDTNSCLSAIPAKKRKIPIFHMEAGNRCYDERVPEETNRKIVDHISDINLPYSDIAREYLLKEGIASDRVIKTGSPMHEVLQYYLPKIRSSRSLVDLNILPGEYYVVSVHREENVNTPHRFDQLVLALNTLVALDNLPIIISTHPRTRKVIESRGIKFDKRIQLLKPLAFTDYVHLQMNSRAVLSDSGTISEESSILGFPALNLRESHERPEAMEEGVVMMVGFELERILQGLSILKNQTSRNRNVRDYESLFVSEKIERIIVSYCSYVSRVVWGGGDSK